MSVLKKIILWVVLGLILAAGLFTYKGYVWKTYEGRLIQAGFKGSVPKTGGTATIQSYIFDFSVANEEIANELMRCSGKTIEVHYKEYLGALPWRGMQKHVVDKIISVTSPENL